MRRYEPRSPRGSLLLHLIATTLLSGALSGCATITPPPSSGERALDEAEDINSFGLGAGRYFASRGLDFGDMVHFGVEVGPGIGVDVMVTDYLRMAAMRRWSAGVGFQGFRYPPMKSADEGYGYFGPMRSGGTRSGAPWYVNAWDFRVDAQAVVVGANVAVNLAEIFDFLAGWFTIDFMQDDLGVYDYYETEGSYEK